MPRRFRIVIAAAALAALATYANAAAATAHASEPYTCLEFEDDSFACGTVTQSADPNDPSWTIDKSKDWISGCIPGGLCDNELTRHSPSRHKGRTV